MGRATKRAAQELTGDDGNFVVTTDLARWTGSCPEAARRTKRPEDRNAIAVEDRGIQTLKKDLAARAGSGATTVHGAPEDVEKQPATEFRAFQDNADKFQHNKDLTDRQGRGRLPSADERGEEPQPSVRRRAAAGGRGLHDRPQHGALRCRRCRATRRAG